MFKVIGALVVYGFALFGVAKFVESREEAAGEGAQGTAARVFKIVR